MYTSLLETPLGELIISGTESAVSFIGYDRGIIETEANDITERAAGQFKEYFDGKRLTFDFPFKQEGSPFQQKVWDELMYVKAGAPISYTNLSRKMNNPLAIRAIASANGKNKLMILVPCHRIIGANGDLVGYAGGLWRKKWLLEHEARVTGTGQTLLFDPR